jgi:hypothetical protein
MDDNKRIRLELSFLLILVALVVVSVVLMIIFPNVITPRRLLFLLSVSSIGYAISGLFTGVLRLRYGWCDKYKDPVWFWITFFIFFLGGTAMFVRGLFLR